jgi:hypothetical protein
MIRVREVLDKLYPKITLIIEGVASGADSLARRYAKLNHIEVETYEADWYNLKAKPCIVRVDGFGRRYNVLAGPTRNQRMIDEGKPNLVIGFPGGSGTADMLRRARKAGIPVEKVKG